MLKINNDQQSVRRVYVEKSRRELLLVRMQHCVLHRMGLHDYSQLRVLLPGIQSVTKGTYMLRIYEMRWTLIVN